MHTAATPAYLTRAPRGFTLIELLVVLLIIGLVSGLVLPRLASVFNSTQLAYEREDVFEKLTTLGAKARLRQQRYEINAAFGRMPFDLPDGWQFQTPSPIIYKENGVCLGGRLTLINRRESIELTLEPPYCRPQAS